ncbi:phosphate ABC transporter permease [Frondihabitans sp. PAMC 28766]|uniref:phosphate ABC transporter permease subunit PstC n=1 Tax=Frondihabitans sp. PAMC 28766 TaxID=1795630 RepID=UPI00078E3708|nr:phosphate ABC transporter permease subunit PstC [Frondihabitans sp. PAMC 28766]AMM19909.1 phosphate ABC transporter permease [Frondihabitans sp. PAMC 28766]
MTASAERPAPTRSSRPKATVRIGDRVFSLATLISGSLILLVLVLVALFLIVQSIPAFTAKPGTLPDASKNFWVYVGPLVFGTIWAAILALIMATPFSLGIALFISHYAPRRISQVLGYIIDLLAAVPSVVFGLWGVLVLAPFVQPFYNTLVTHAGWFPLFAGPVSGTGKTILTAAIVLAVMCIPIMTAVMREIFLQAPRLHEEAALALGATRWEMIRMAVLPFARSGIVSAIMLGLGRALGETLAIAIVLSPATVINVFLLTSTNPNTIAANIALQFNEAQGVGLNTLIASGLILFVITLVINMLARFVVNRRKAFSGAN